MILYDKEFDKVMKQLGDTLRSDAVERVLSHMFSIHNAVEDLRKSRDSWKNKFKELERRMKDK